MDINELDRNIIMDVDNEAEKSLDEPIRDQQIDIKKEMDIEQVVDIVEVYLKEENKIKEEFDIQEEVNIKEEFDIQEVNIKKEDDIQEMVYLNEAVLQEDLNINTINVKQEIESDTLTAQKESLRGLAINKNAYSVYVQTSDCDQLGIAILTKSLVEYTNENRRLKEKISDFKKNAALKRVMLDVSLQECQQENKRLKMKIEENLSNSFVKKMQSNEVKKTKSKTAKRFSPEFKQIALNLYLCSNVAYNYMSATFHLPKISVLHRFMAETPVGIIDEAFEALEQAVKQMKPLEKICNVCVDYMPIGPINSQRKLSFGRHEIDGMKKDLPAKYALVVAVTGTVVRWRQIVGFALTADCCHYPELIAWIEKVITQLIDIQLDVRCLVTDTSAFFWTEIGNKELSVHKTHFEVNGKKILYIFDVPHLIRSARNALMKNDLKYLDGKVAKWSVVEKVSEKSQTRLTKKHTSPSGAAARTTEFAAQTFSLSVAKAIQNLVVENVLEREAIDSAVLLVKLNNLFDILNSSQCKKSIIYFFKKPYRGNSEQKQFFKETLNFLESIKIEKDASTGRVTTPRFAEGFMITITSVMALYEDLEGVDILWSRNLNMESLGVLFKVVKRLLPRTRFIAASKFTRGLLKASLTDSLKLPGKTETKKGREDSAISSLFSWAG